MAVRRATDTGVARNIVVAGSLLAKERWRVILFERVCTEGAPRSVLFSSIPVYYHKPYPHKFFIWSHVLPSTQLNFSKLSKDYDMAAKKYAKLSEEFKLARGKLFACESCQSDLAASQLQLAQSEQAREALKQENQMLESERNKLNLELQQAKKAQPKPKTTEKKK